MDQNAGQGHRKSMTSDILADWKKNKFIVAPSSLTDHPYSMILLTDIKYWAEHADDLKVWCDDNQIGTKGMTVTTDTEEKLLLFLLKWS